jgi:hypothetical protein
VAKVNRRMHSKEPTATAHRSDTRLCRKSAAGDATAPTVLLSVSADYNAHFICRFKLSFVTGEHRVARTITVSSFTVALAAVGFYLGTTIHGASWLAFISTVAGGAGGCLASVVAFDLWRKRPAG